MTVSKTENNLIQIYIVQLLKNLKKLNDKFFKYRMHFELFIAYKKAFGITRNRIEFESISGFKCIQVLGFRIDNKTFSIRKTRRKFIKLFLDMNNRIKTTKTKKTIVLFF